LRNALALLDLECPVEEPHTNLHRFEFALQDLSSGKSRVVGKKKEVAQQLCPERALKELLCSDRPVIFVEAAAAMDPRGRLGEGGAYDVVECELLSILREAKVRGQAVVFAAGSVQHGLSRAALFQPALATHGLRCGHLRWRDCNDPLFSGGQAWARDERQEWRTCIGLQFP